MSQQINLYEDRLRPRLELATALNVALVSLVALMAVAMLAAWTYFDAERKAAAAVQARQVLQAAQEQVKAAAQKAAERKVSPGLQVELSAAKAKLQAGQEVIGALEHGRLADSGEFSQFMQGFAKQAQNDLWLTGFRITDGGQEIEIRGRTLDAALVPAYVQRLDSIPVFQGRRFAALDMRGVEDAGDKATATATATAVDSKEGAAKAKLPPYVEFVLRSEHIAAEDGPITGKAMQ